MNESVNGKLANACFGAKQKILQGANEWVPPEVLAASGWDDAAIENRTKAMATEAREKIFRG